MRRFLLLYSYHDDEIQRFAEGLIHYDETVYVRGFYPKEMARTYYDLLALKSYLRDNDQVRSFNIVMIDQEAK
jgi:hypothetical protein